MYARRYSSKTFVLKNVLHFNYFVTETMFCINYFHLSVVTKDISNDNDIQ